MDESAFLRHVLCSAVPGDDGRVLVPPGDDLGAVRTAGGGMLLAGVDQLVAGVHAAADTPLRKLGRKAVTRALSDVAAMGARPLGALAAGTLEGETGDDAVATLFDAMRETAGAFGAPLFGGDVGCAAQPITLSVTVLAEPECSGPLLRAGARVGDRILVTGRLGGSLAALPEGTHHLDFVPRLREGQMLARQGEATHDCPVHALIDLSDGLGRDLGRLCEASGAAAEIEAEALPIAHGATVAAARTGHPAWHHALGDGEDYELCFTVPPEAAERFPEKLGETPVTEIGRIVEPTGGSKVRLRTPEGTRLDADDLGWRHGG
jgi:thiamine-monophosphate kinase